MKLRKVSEKLELPMTYVNNLVQELERLGILKFVSKYSHSIPMNQQKNCIRVVRADSPFSIEWLVTADCNCNCCYCIYEKYRKNSTKELSKSEALDLVHEMGELGVMNVTLSGGEPFLRPDVMEIIQELYDFGITIRLDTNGILLTGDLARRLVRYSDLLEISVSLDSLRSEVNDRLRMYPKATERVVKNIRRLKNLGLYLNVSTVLTRLNARTPIVAELFDFLSNVGVEEWTIAFVRPFGKARKNWELLCLFANDLPELTFELLTLSKESKKPKINFIVNMNSLANLQSSISKRLDLSNIRSCEDCQGEGFLSITPSGDVYTCLFLPREIAEVGNTRQESLAKLWEKAKITFPLERPPSEHFIRKCSQCKHLSLCKGGCRANALALSGDITGCDPIARDRIEAFLTWLSKA